MAKSLTDRARLWLARNLIKAASLPQLPEWISYAFVEPTFRTLVHEGYHANSVVFACVSTLAFSFPEPPLRLMTLQPGGAEPVAHPLANLLASPNEDMSGVDLLQATIIALSVGGNSYWLKVRSASGAVVELYPLNDAQVTPIAGKNVVTSHYEIYDAEGQTSEVPKRDIVHFQWLVDPIHPWRGTAPLIAAAHEVDTDNEAARYVYAVLRNDAIPRIALVAPADADLTDESIGRLRTKWSEQYGQANRGTPAILWGGLDIKQLSLSLSELAFDGLRRLPETRIAAALRVPPIVAGLNAGLDASTYSNYEQAARWFTERTLVPLWRSVEDQITRSLLPEWGEAPGTFARFDTSQVVALGEQMTAKREYVHQALSGGYITVNEGRAILGLSQDANGDVYLRSPALVAVPSQALTEGEAGETPSLEPPDVSEEGVPAVYGEDNVQNPGAPESAVVDGTYVHGLDPEDAEFKIGAATIRHLRTILRSQLEIRNASAGRMELELETYFDDLSDRVSSRAEKAWSAALETKALPDADTLLTNADDERLDTLLREYYAETIRLTYGVLNVTLRRFRSFSADDPLVQQVLGQAGKQVRDISRTTRKAVRELVKQALADGWTTEELIRGKGKQRGLRRLIEETYRGRARTIAITELGNAQNRIAVERFAEAGLKKVYVGDNGQRDPDEPCQRVNGTVRSLTWARNNPLEHPNCTRTFAPVK